MIGKASNRNNKSFSIKAIEKAFGLLYNLLYNVFIRSNFGNEENEMVNVNDHLGLTDSESFENAIEHKGPDGIIIIPPRVSGIDKDREYWLIDRAILLPENTTVIMQNSTIKLSDKCRDNFFRTSNCGMGIEFPERIKNVHIKGVGACTLIGADHPRATGDGTKILADPCPYETDDLCKMADWIPEERRSAEKINFWDRHDHSYGTDAGTDESQYGDWRGIGVLFANVENFSIENLHIVDSHGWGISLEECANGHIKNICFNACMSKMIDGLRSNMENQDGIDLRNGCHDIMISDISGRTGDDVIALTAIAGSKYMPGGSLCNTHVMHNDWSKRERDIYNITIRNVTAYSNLCLIVRLLPVMSHIRNVIIDGVIDNTPENISHLATMDLGSDLGYGAIVTDAMSEIIISNVICNGDHGISVGKGLCDSVISNVINKKKGTPLISGEENMVNVKTENLVQA